MTIIYGHEDDVPDFGQRFLKITVKAVARLGVVTNSGLH